MQDRTSTIYVRAIDGSVFHLPMPALHLGGNRYRLLLCKEFDPDDTHVLLEYLPGDTVEVAPKTFPRDQRPVLVATAMTQTVAQDRAYWDLLFQIVLKGPESTLEMTPERRLAVKRIARELSETSRYHYPAVRKWAERNAALLAD